MRVHDFPLFLPISMIFQSSIFKLKCLRFFFFLNLGRQSRPQERLPDTNQRRQRSKCPTRSPSEPKNKGQLATHAMTFLVCGLQVRWKQVVAYELTSDSFNAETIADYIKKLLKRLYDSGLRPRSVTMDMGPGNVAV